MSESGTGMRLLGIDTLATRWDVSKISIRRLIDSGELKSVTIGARRLVPLREIERAELHGIGTARKRVARGEAT